MYKVIDYRNQKESKLFLKLFETCVALLVLTFQIPELFVTGKQSVILSKI